MLAATMLDTHGFVPCELLCMLNLVLDAVPARGECPLRHSLQIAKPVRLDGFLIGTDAYLRELPSPGTVWEREGVIRRRMFYHGNVSLIVLILRSWLLTYIVCPSADTDEGELLEVRMDALGVMFPWLCRAFAFRARAGAEPVTYAVLVPTALPTHTCPRPMYQTSDPLPVLVMSLPADQGSLLGLDWDQAQTEALFPAHLVSISASTP